MKIALLGYGKMGQAIEKIAIERGHEIVIRKDVEPIEVDLNMADVAIDFSHPTAAYDNIKNCIDNRVPVVSGTTGWLDKYEEIVAYCEKREGSFIYASNFSIGVNLFFNLNSQLAELMKNIGEYEVAMEETHHIHKLDRLSGPGGSMPAYSVGDQRPRGECSRRFSAETRGPAQHGGNFRRAVILRVPPRIPG